MSDRYRRKVAALSAAVGPDVEYLPTLIVGVPQAPDVVWITIDRPVITVRLTVEGARQLVEALWGALNA